MTQLIVPVEPRRLMGSAVVPAASVLTTSKTSSIPRQGARFLFIGSAGTAVQLGLFAASSPAVGVQIASVASWLISTLVTNAAHRAVTFGVRGAASNRVDQLAALLTCLVGLTITSMVLAQLSDATGTSGLIAILAVNAAVGAGRFVGMRWWLGGSGRRSATRLAVALNTARDNWHDHHRFCGLHR